MAVTVVTKPAKTSQKEVPSKAIHAKEVLPVLVTVVEQIIACRKEIDKSFLKMGKLLCKAKKDKSYAPFGNFPDLVEKGAQTTMTKARKLMDIHEVFVVAHKVNLDHLSAIGYTRLAAITANVIENPNDIEKLLKMAHQKNSETIKESLEYGEDFEPLVRISFTISESQRARLDEILEFRGAKRRGKTFESESRNESFMMCIDYLAKDMYQTTLERKKAMRKLKEADKLTPVVHMK